MMFYSVLLVISCLKGFLGNGCSITEIISGKFSFLTKQLYDRFGQKLVSPLL